MTVLVLDSPDLIALAAIAAGTGSNPFVSGSRPPRQIRFHYGFNKHSLNADDLAALEQHAVYLNRHPGLQICVHGHSDNFGAENYNQFLARLRAHAVVRALAEQGVRESQMTIRIWGSARPLATPEDRAANRRVELEYLSHRAVKTAQG
jgi:peptidoglycan-associated lipoprotein